MRSPDRGTHRAFRPRFFCDCSNYIAQILSKYPILFPKFLHSIESSVNSENAAARGQTRHVPLHSTIMHFPDARDRKLGITPYKKSQINHGDKPVQAQRVHFLGNHPPNSKSETNTVIPIVLRMPDYPAIRTGAVPL